jgi:hypothetical protein
MTLWLQPHYCLPSEALWILRFWFLLFMRLFTLLVSILFFDLFVSLLENFVWMAGWWATMHSSDDQTLEVMITINNSLSLLTDGNYIPRFLYFVKIFIRLWKYELFWYNCDLQYKKVLYFRLVNLMLNHSFWPKVERMEPEKLSRQEFGYEESTHKYLLGPGLLHRPEVGCGLLRVY